jgi:Flp pilus assembly pilin Flp
MHGAHPPRGAFIRPLWQQLIARCCAVAARFFGDQHGAELVEWSILTVLVVVVGYAILVSVREEASALFTRLLLRFFR